MLFSRPQEALPNSCLNPVTLFIYFCSLEFSCQQVWRSALLAESMKFLNILILLEELTNFFQLTQRPCCFSCCYWLIAESCSCLAQSFARSYLELDWSDTSLSWSCCTWPETLSRVPLNNFKLLFLVYYSDSRTSLRSLRFQTLLSTSLFDNSRCSSFSSLAQFSILHYLYSIQKLPFRSLRYKRWASLASLLHLESLSHVISCTSDLYKVQRPVMQVIKNHDLRAQVYRCEARCALSCWIGLQSGESMSGC